jgi:hypothetical protein
MTVATEDVVRIEPDGNRLALTGAVLYLLEWIAIIAAAPPGPFGPGTDAQRLVHDYTTHARGAAFAAGWFAVVLAGRVLFIAGVKASLRRWPRERPLLDLALGAMAISVALEVATYAIVAGTARAAADGVASATVVALDGLAFWLNVLIFGPLGLAVLAAAIAMVRSRAFPSWIAWVGVVAGVAGMAAALVTGATTTDSASGATGPFTGVAAVGMWVWMIATGVVLWRRPGVPAHTVLPASITGLSAPAAHGRTTAREG